MRLIDADALKTLFSDIAKEQPDLTGASETLGKIIDFQPTISPAANWTPCSVGLPKKAGIYLITYAESSLNREWKRDVCRARFTKAGWTFDRMACRTVLAWQPLPEPYRGGE